MGQRPGFGLRTLQADAEFGALGRALVPRVRHFAQDRQQVQGAVLRGRFDRAARSIAATEAKSERDR